MLVADDRRGGPESAGAPSRELFSAADVTRTIARIAHQIIEKTAEADDVVLIGIPTRGAVLARRLAATIAAKAPIAVRYMLDAVRWGAQLPLGEAQALEATLFGLVASTADMREGTRAFLEKRPPEFKGA